MPHAPRTPPPSSAFVASKRAQSFGRKRITINVRLVSGHDLKPEDKKTGSSDPYVVMHVGSQKRKSSVIWQNLNPVWNEDFQFTVPDDFPKPLQFKVYDRDVGVADLDDFMGKAQVSLADMLHCEELAFPPIELSTQGTLKIVVRKVGEAAAPPSALETVATPFKLVGDGLATAAGSVKSAMPFDVEAPPAAAAGAASAAPGDDDETDSEVEDEVDWEKAHSLAPTSDHEELMRRYLARARNPESVIEAVERAGRNLDNKMVGFLRGTAESTVDKVLAGVGKTVERSVEIEGAPARVTASLGVFAREVWTALLPKLRESLIGPVPGDYGAYLIRNWARRYPYFWGPESGLPRPLTWLRARVLYALYPADKTIFQARAERGGGAAPAPPPPWPSSLPRWPVWLASHCARRFARLPPVALTPRSPPLAARAPGARRSCARCRCTGC